MTDGTAMIAKGIDRNGELYQQRAFDALPLLVRQSQVGQTIFYGELSDEMKMPNARNLNFVLGAIGTSLTALGKSWGEEVPPLQALVVNRATGLPGEGFGREFVDPMMLEGVSSRTRKQVVDGMLAAVFTYRKWDKVLAHFGASAVTYNRQLVDRTAAGRRAGNGESTAHRELKERIAREPTLVGITKQVLETTVEYRLPTGDEVDVLFRTRKGVVAVEVKSYISLEEDLARGVFQCVKYDALLNAVSASIGARQDVETILALGGALTDATRALANTLGVQVTEHLEAGTH
jgi:hypothetical protein